MSFELYLTHIGIVTYCLHKGLSVLLVIQFVVFSFLLTVCVYNMHKLICKKGRRLNLNEALNK